MKKVSMQPIVEFIKSHEVEIADKKVVAGVEYGKFRLAFGDMFGRWPVGKGRDEAV